LRLLLGKLPPDLLSKYTLRMTGAPSKNLVVPPKVGFDFGVVKLENRFLIVSSDPVTGVVEDIGWHAVVVSANDVATSGHRPQFIQSVILLPEGAKESLVREISRRVGTTARKLGITIVGGHTELTPGLKRPVLITTAFAMADSFVTSADARVGDTIMMTKSAGIEGTAILAREAAKLGLNSHLVRRAAKLRGRMSIIEEAEASFKTGSVHAMHDCTEGGVLGGIYEMSVASGLGFEVHAAKILVSRETAGVCSALRIDPLRLIASGALLLAVKRGEEESVRMALGDLGVPVSSIGGFVAEKRVLFSPEGRKTWIRDAPTDELWRIGG